MAITRLLRSAHLPRDAASSIAPNGKPHVYPPYRSLATTTPSPRIHVLGLGSIGTFAAHTLADIPEKPAVTLLLHRPALLQGYIRNGRKVILQTRQGDVVSRGGYDLDVLHGDQWHPIDPTAPNPGHGLGQDTQSSPITDLIANLIVCVKTTQTVTALRPLLPRLSRDSAILFLQNGAGMIEDVNKQLWPTRSARPNFMTGVTSHGVGLNRSFHVTHTGPSATSVGPVPRHETASTVDTASPTAPVASPLNSYLLETLPKAARLNCKAYAWPDIMQIQLEKLAVNALSNPLCALADSDNEYILTIPETVRKLMEEISAVILALPELQGVSGVAERFSTPVLEATVMDIIVRNRNTISSMVWDLRAGRETEIRYINGYWARRGREVGVPTPMNDDIVSKIEQRTAERIGEQGMQHSRP
ncbi:putative 2-dehydropantoate 2-reductase family protein [Plenodomus tracheiphilus IPT5]|uniref:2-dehydropantoate 2-reductase n=1 Tax=Plenodomus tracheiphilus IPT5 TaxID=1408161 RepID=A0A6A7B4W4_9PLEO|nr:putative 2-dehydropantoate 2-reductase family protein [Plenodomus tracheiphilus IPT5]